ncbi:MAG: glycosyltransferase, partial [Chloroflexi bacterium]|nr:glycosyltransferase [Chloroflexota bacterium]
DAPVYTSYFDAEVFGDRLDPARVRAWPLARIPWKPNNFRVLYPVYAAYFEQLRINADLVLSSSIAFSKAVRTRSDAVHLSYVYTPMRYAWDLDTYLDRSSHSSVARVGARAIQPAMKSWDVRTAKRPDTLIAISETVRDRIERLWRRRAAHVIHPPVPVHEIALSSEVGAFFLVAARLLAYRRIDVAVAACTALGVRLIVAGDGPELKRLRAAAGPSVSFVGRVERSELLDLFSRCRAYLVPGVEDFGIAPVEAMAAGKPVVAYRGGGARETVLHGVTGILTDDASVDGLRSAIRQLDDFDWNPAGIRAHAENFATSAFRSRWRTLLKDAGFGSVLAQEPPPQPPA